MIKIDIKAYIVLLMISLLFSMAAADTELTLTPEEQVWIVEHPVVRARISNSPPYHFWKNGPQGISIELLDRIAEMYGFQIEYNYGDMSWSEALENIRNHEKVDLLLTAKHTSERESFLVFSQDYLILPWVIFTRQDENTVFSMQDLFDKTIAIEKGYVMQELLAKEFAQIKQIEFDDAAEALAAVSENLADAYVGNLTIAQYHIAHLGFTNLKVAAPTGLGDHTQAFAVRDDWPQLGTILDKGLASITPEERSTINRKYFTVEVAQKVDYTRLLWALLGIGLVVASILFWNYSLQRQIAERKQAEKALKKSEDRLRKAQEVAKIGNWEYDISTGKIWGSEEAFRIYGCERKTPYLPLDEVEGCIREVERVNKALRDLITKNVAYNIEFELKPLNREGLTIVHSIAELACDESNNPLKVLGVIQDITNAKAKERDQLKLQAQLQQAQKMESVGRLAGGVAHDFNNMLGVILGHTDILLEEISSDKPIYSNLEEIRKAGERSSNLTRQLLAFARQQTVSPKVLNLNQAIEGMLNMLRRLIGEHINLTWLPGNNQMIVNMDPAQIDQILANLCLNARDAITNIGKVTIETGYTSFDEDYCAFHKGSVPGEFVMLAVSDDGCGIDEETQTNIFEPFYTTKEQGKGTGLGLATIYGIVKQNSGFINVYSEPGLGTTFRIYLPRHIGKTSHMMKTDASKQEARGHETILLVEDELSILKMTTMMLERQGYTVVATSKPGEAIRLVEEYKGPIHLLMTDVIMPEMNGRDLARNILDLYPNINRLFMSGYTADVIAHHGVLNKGVNFIQKPFSQKELATKVREALGNAAE